MELLIPGLLIVALMVYASTRIKKTAAAAFESETIETDEYIIQKPEGFLHVLNGDPRYVFEAYSKEFAESDSKDVRLGRATMRIVPDTTIENVIKSISDSGDQITGDLGEVVGDHHYRLIDASRSENNMEFHVRHKFAEKNGAVYAFEAIGVAETSDEFSRKIDMLTDGFELK